MNRATLLASIGVTFLVLIFYFLNKDNDKKTFEKISRLKMEGEIAIGEIQGKTYSTVGNSHNRNCVIYWFTYDNSTRVIGYLKSYEANALSGRMDREWKENFENTQKGDKYIVLYDKNNPELSIICLDEPIKDSLDFKRYLKTIEQSP